MSFEVAIYNAGCDDGKKVIDSIKSAYLYADKVRIYDYPFTHQMIEIKAIMNHMWEIYERSDKREGINYSYSPRHKYKEVYIRYCEELKERGIDAFPEEFKSYFDRPRVEAVLDYVGYVTNMLEAREHNSKLFERGEFTKDIERMGVECIVPEQIEGFSYGFDGFADFNNKFYSDNGYKLFNYFPKDIKSNAFSSPILVPSYLSGYAISKLPGFENATLDEMIDIRKELDVYIKPYRDAIEEISKEIKEIPDSESLQHECAALYLDKVEPKVKEINAQIRRNNVFKNIFAKAFTSELGWTCIGGIVAAIATGGNIQNALGIASGVALGGFSAINGMIDTDKKEKEIQDNQLYFLYKAGEILESEYM